MLPLLQGSAETLTRRGGKLYHLPIAYFLLKIPKIIKIQWRTFELQLKTSGILFMGQYRRRFVLPVL